MGEIEGPQQIKEEVRGRIAGHGFRDSDQHEALRANDKQRRWWFLVALCIAFILVGQFFAKSLQRVLHYQAGPGTWTLALAQTAAFPVLIIPLLFFSSGRKAPRNTTDPESKPSILTVCFIYFSMGVLLAAATMLYLVGILYLPLTTHSFISATQLVYSVVFYFLINRKGSSPLIIVSAVLVTVSASLPARLVGYTIPGKPDAGQIVYLIGYLCTEFASAAFCLMLSLMQLSFKKVILKRKKKTFAVVLEMQFYTSLIATCILLVGYLLTQEWTSFRGRMEGFPAGNAAYVLTLVAAALGFQVYAVGLVGLVFLVSSLFSNVVNVFAFAFLPTLAVVLFDEKMTWSRAVAMPLAILGFACYLFQLRRKKTEEKVNQLNRKHIGEA